MLPRAPLRRLSDVARLDRVNAWTVLACLRPVYASHWQHVRQVQLRTASSASSTRWKARQSNEHYAREAKVQGLRSRAAFKLLQINERHKIFKRGDTVVDLGYAPGSWTQVAVNRTAPGGRVVGVDILPAQPPRGASTIQGDFLSPAIQAEVRAYVLDPNRGRPRKRTIFRSDDDAAEHDADEGPETVQEEDYIALERRVSARSEESSAELPGTPIEVAGHEASSGQERAEQAKQRVVDVVLSDMSEPWELTTGFWKRSLSDPYYRMMNTSGTPFRDHAGSMDLCGAALDFCFDTLREGGHFVCKFYQGAEDKALEKRLKRLFDKVHREKPAASRSESREGYFVALRRKATPAKAEVFAD